MVAAAGLSVVRLTFWNAELEGLARLNGKGIALAAALLILTRWVKPTKKLHPIVFILASAVVGAALGF